MNVKKSTEGRLIAATLCLSILIVSCVIPSPTPTLTSPPDVTPTVTFSPTRTASATVREPTSTRMYPYIEVVDEGITQLELTPEFIELPPGQYLAYLSWGSTEDQTLDMLMYISPRRQYQGQVLSGETQASFFRVDSLLPDARMMVKIAYNETMPFVYLVYRNDNGSEQVVIRVLNLTNGEMQRWRVVATPGSLCDFAGGTGANHFYVPLLCKYRQTETLVLLDPVAGTSRNYVLENWCTDSNNLVVRFRGIDWLADDRVWVFCQGRDYFTMSGCMLSLQTGDLMCVRDIGAVRAVSPIDNTVIAVGQGSQAGEYYYYVTEADCIIDESRCLEMVKIARINGSTEQFTWSNDGATIGYSSSESSDNINFYTTLALVDPRDGSIQLITQGLRGTHSVDDFSPDDQWVTLWGFPIMSWVSLETGELFQLADSHFIGWLVNP